MEIRSDIEIAQACEKRKITEIAAAAGIDDMNYPLTVPEGSAFALCDDRNNRLDSRSSRFGLVKLADVRGEARAIIWPVYRAGLLARAPKVR